MIQFPHAKINLGLRVLRRRTDDFHDISSIFYPIPFNDIIEIMESPQSGPVYLTQTGIDIPGTMADNLCIKAFQLLKKDFPSLPAVKMHLHKSIPPGAGLGGGSADAAFVLKLLNEKFQLNISQEQLLDYAATLGSDCPFFIIDKPCHAEGRGEKLTPVALNLSAYQMVLVMPGIHVSTREAFAGIIPNEKQDDVAMIIQQDPAQWKDQLKNDFETTIFRLYPEIGEIKKQLYHAGAVYASMTGSGSAVYGLFPSANTIAFSFPEGYSVKILPGQFQ